MWKIRHRSEKISSHEREPTINSVIMITDVINMMVAVIIMMVAVIIMMVAVINMMVAVIIMMVAVIIMMVAVINMMVAVIATMVDIFIMMVDVIIVIADIITIITHYYDGVPFVCPKFTVIGLISGAGTCSRGSTRTIFRSTFGSSASESLSNFTCFLSIASSTPSRVTTNLGLGALIF